MLVRARACVCVFVRVCVCACACACFTVYLCVCARVRAYLVDEPLVERARVVQLVPQRALQLRRGRARATAPGREVHQFSGSKSMLRGPLVLPGGTRSGPQSE